MPGAHGIASLTSQEALGTVRDFVSEDKVETNMMTNWPSHARAHICNCTCTYIHRHTHEYVHITHQILLFINEHICIWAYTMCSHVYERWRKILALDELKFQVVVSHSRQVLGVELGAFSEKTASAFKCWALSPVP